jgi:hypothetical protein
LGNVYNLNAVALKPINDEKKIRPHPIKKIEGNPIYVASERTPHVQTRNPRSCSHSWNQFVCVWIGDYGGVDCQKDRQPKLGTKCEPQNAVFPKKIELISKSI